MGPMSMGRAFVTGLLAAAPALLGGCATMINGTTQRVSVTSTPPGAAVLVDGKEAGTTPKTVILDRSRAHEVTLRMAGQPEYRQVLVTRVSRAFIGCDGVLLFIGGIGLITGFVDMMTGAMYTLSPEEVAYAFGGASAAGAGVPPAGLGPGVPPPPGLNHVAVAELDAQGVSKTDAAVIADLLRNRLVNVAGFTVVEKKNMDKVLAEQAFQQTGCTTQECAVKLGKLLNVQGMIVGSFGKLLNRYFINVRLVNVETGAAVYADEAKGDTVDQLESAIDGLAARMGGKPREQRPR